MRLIPGIVLLLVSMLASGLSDKKSSSDTSSNTMTPPKAEINIVVDDYHGHKVSDPYRWLEDAKSPQTQRFVEEQNTYTQRVLDSIAGKDKLHQRLEQLLSIGRLETPQPAGNYVFYEKREGQQNQPVVYVREGHNGKDRSLIDVNDLAPDGTVALDWWYPSHDGKYVVYGTSPNGSENSTLRVIVTATGKLLPEQIGRTRAAGMAWLPDNSGFYYTRYPRPGDVPAGQEMYNRHVFFHKLGSTDNTDGLKDPLIFGEGMDSTFWPSPDLSQDGQWLLISISEGWTKSELYLKHLTEPDSKFVSVTSGKNFLYNADMYDGQLYITTNEDAPRYRVLKAACSNPERSQWKEIIPQAESVIENAAALIGRRLFVPYLQNASSALTIYDLDGKRIADVPMPTLGSLNGRPGGDQDSKEAFFTVELLDASVRNGDTFTQRGRADLLPVEEAQRHRVVRQAMHTLHVPADLLDQLVFA